MAQKRLSEATKKRLKAGRMLLAGKGCAEVALAVGVARQTVYTWKRLLDEGGQLVVDHALAANCPYFFSDRLFVLLVPLALTDLHVMRHHRK